MHRPSTNDKLLLEAVEHRYGNMSDLVEAAHARDLHKQRRETSNEQHKAKPSLHRKRVRRHVQMIRVVAPHAGEFRKDNPDELLDCGLATKTSHTSGEQAFRPIQKKRVRFERNAIRALKQQIEITWD